MHLVSSQHQVVLPNCLFLLLIRQYPLEEMLATGNFGFTKSACKSVLPLYLDMEAEGCYEIHENCGLPKKKKNVNTVVSSFGSCEF